MKKNLYIVLFSVACTILAMGCQEKRGCTDPYADNYDTEATQDDDTCVPRRDKFLGDFEANATILLGSDTLVPYDDVFVEIEDSTVTSQDGVLIRVTNLDPDHTVLPLDGVVNTTYDMTIVPQNIGDVSYSGDGNINGRVLEMYITRLEKITLPDETFFYDTLYLNIHGIKELEE